jgi:tryptophan synthase alpha chain
LEELPNILRSLESAGADLIEIGIPFSDPIADGPVIQASSQRSLDLGTTPDAVLSALALAEVSIPVVLMGYFNPIHRIGLTQFSLKAKAAGASGVIVSDLIPEEGREWSEAAKASGLDTIFLAAPTSTDERLRAVADACSGFVYAVSRTGVTGLAESNQSDVESLVNRMRAHTALPIAVGFGISTPEHVRFVAKHADAAVVGSWRLKGFDERDDRVLIGFAKLSKRLGCCPGLAAVLFNRFGQCFDAAIVPIRSRVLSDSP